MINGWFPRLNGRGQVVSGAGAVFLDDRALGAGWGPDFVTDDLMVIPREGETALLEVGADAVPVVLPGGYNRVAAGGGYWLGWLATTPTTLRLFRGASLVREWRDAAAPAMAPGGRYLFLMPYQAEYRTVLLGEPGDASPVPIFAGAAMDLSVSDFTIAIQVATGKYTRAVLGRRFGSAAWEEWTIQSWEAPIAVDGPGGAAWVLSVTQSGIILRPAGARMGYAFGGDWYNPAVRFLGGVFVIVASDGAGGRKRITVDPGAPRVALEAPAPPVIPPVPPQPPQPPQPQPQPRPRPPVPQPPARPASPLASPPVARKVGRMEETEIVGLIGPGGKFARVDPHTKAITFDRATVGADERIEVTKPDALYQLRAVAADVILGADATQYGIDICAQFYTLPVGRRGNYESWAITEQPSGLLLARIEYLEQGAEAGRRHASAGLTVVRGV